MRLIEFANKNVGIVKLKSKRSQTLIREVTLK